MGNKSVQHARPSKGGYLSTSVTVASGSSLASGEIDVRGHVVTHLIVSRAPNPASDIGFKARVDGYSTSNVVWDTENDVPLKLDTNSTARLYIIPTNPGLTGLHYIKPYYVSLTSTNTSAVNQTGGATTIWIAGIS